MASGFLPNNECFPLLTTCTVNITFLPRLTCQQKEINSDVLNNKKKDLKDLCPVKVSVNLRSFQIKCDIVDYLWVA